MTAGGGGGGSRGLVAGWRERKEKKAWYFYLVENYSKLDTITWLSFILLENIF